MSKIESPTGEISFVVNGVLHTISALSQLPLTISLNSYLRDVAGLKGTKVMCREAGCGCCAVSVTHLEPLSDQYQTYTVPSCLTPLYSVDGWQITTTEGIGSQIDGFHPIQERIAQFNGTQCGYCTPGMVMNMYGLLHQYPNATSEDVEDNFDGNLCRCTGYRPILDGMKSFTTGHKGGNSIDIEDLDRKLCLKTGKPCLKSSSCLDLERDGTHWYRPVSLKALSTLLQANKERKIRLLFGNTACGVYKHDGHFDVYVDLHNIKELYCFQIDVDSMKIGAATTLTQLVQKLKENQTKHGFKYFSTVYKHFKQLGNAMVRNVGCVAGNLMLKHAHPEFPSDVFTVFAALGATLEIHDAVTSKSASYTMMDFLKNVNMSSKIITAVVLPSLNEDTSFESYTVTPRWQNARAYVNAAFKFECKNNTIYNQPSIVYGGICSEMNHAPKTEKFLTNKPISKQVLTNALNILKEEIAPDKGQLLASTSYRKSLALTLLYKAFLKICQPSDERLTSGQWSLNHPVSSGLQTYPILTKESPLKVALPKQTATLQASGETVYVNDIPNFQHELYGAFVISTVASAILESIDPSEALNMPGVVKFLTAKDIPEGGKNDYMASSGLIKLKQEELFATREITFCGQTLGLIIAKTIGQAKAAARKVKVTYSEIFEPILTLQDSIAHNKEYDFSPKEYTVGKPDEALQSVDRVVEGECQLGGQFHFYLETQVSLAVPSEDGIDLYAATQHSEMNQYVAAEVIGKPLNFINVTVPLIGGGFGGKNFNSNVVTAAVTLGAYLTRRPVRMSLDLSTDMQISGKRPPVLAKYKAGFSERGELQVVEVDLYIDCGHKDSMNNVIGPMKIFRYMDMGYHVPNWKVRPHLMFTNKPTMAPARAPGSVPGALIIETIMEHVAASLNIHPIVVKELNLYDNGQFDQLGHEMKHCLMRKVWAQVKEMAEVDQRLKDMESFNQNNLWKKRGLTMSGCKYGMAYVGHGLPATVSIFAGDGSVAVSQGGVEMGQGLYTKVAQAVAYILGVPLENIKVRPNQTIISPNSTISAASIATDSAVFAAIEASKILRERMQPMRNKFPNATWKELCDKCLHNKIDLSARYMFSEGLGKPFFNYFSYSAAAIETEVDILTGQSCIRRVDIVADYGESLNPALDIGQIEGAFMMGLGSYMFEDILFDEKTGKVLNDSTWEYKPPSAKDIPIDWRIHLMSDVSNPFGVCSSKNVGESPISLSVGVLMANKLAVRSACKDLHKDDSYKPTVAPYTVERIQQSVGLTTDDLIF
ncbi:uncharacterized protein LOC131927492 [Physella acuta]|uniref:uncharacterized protein LOC131927492 n=1 Tax=Physella acuta TaxID=109671 RepID=UPI0027DD2FA1|nr:uncharacterized protein LOC131927492 [Physella acuta]